MRLWVRAQDRRPTPDPVRTDDRKAVLTGMVVWIVALGGLLLFLPAVLAAHGTSWLWTVLVGLGIGVVLLIVTHLRQP